MRLAQTTKDKTQHNNSDLCSRKARNVCIQVIGEGLKIKRGNGARIATGMRIAFITPPVRQQISIAECYTIKDLPIRHISKA